MIKSLLKDPSSTVARSIENLLILGENTSSSCTKVSCYSLARLVSVTVFPVFLILELVFKRVPKCFLSLITPTPVKPTHRLDKVLKFAFSILATPFGLLTPDAVSCFFLKNPHASSSICPFGVETKYGVQNIGIQRPLSVGELVTVVNAAIDQDQKIVVIGSGMSQGTQTIPQSPDSCVIDLTNLHDMTFSKDKSSVTVEAGAIWEQVQTAANKLGKSVIVKQASDLFSIGGSISMNCHGWAHDIGSISKTVASINVINAEGCLQTLRPQDELFGCFFGTLGYFGVIVSVELNLVDNEMLQTEAVEITVDQFHEVYQKDYKDKGIPLFGGRLSLDSVGQIPLQSVCMLKYSQVDKRSSTPVITPNFNFEPKFGRRIERVFLQTLAHLNNFFAQRLIRYFWNSEKSQMEKPTRLTRNEALHPPINAFMPLQASHLHTQWLQEYYLKPDKLAPFLEYLGNVLKENDVRVINATIRPTPKDDISILPYADEDRYAVVISFAQMKTKQAEANTEKWINEVNAKLVELEGVYYQAYMPFATQDQFIASYGQSAIERLRLLKNKYDPSGRFGNAHTTKYFDKHIS